MSKGTKATETAREIEEAIFAIHDVRMSPAEFWATILPFQRAYRLTCINTAINRLIEIRDSAPSAAVSDNASSSLMFMWTADDI